MNVNAFYVVFKGLIHPKYKKNVLSIHIKAERYFSIFYIFSINFVLKLSTNQLEYR